MMITNIKINCTSLQISDIWDPFNSFGCHYHKPNGVNRDNNGTN